MSMVLDSTDQGLLTPPGVYKLGVTFCNPLHSTEKQQIKENVYKLQNKY